jgi:hypothetical protein
MHLYLVVKDNGGHREVAHNNMWALIARELRFEWEDGFLVSVVYMQYLDVLEYNFKRNRSKKLADELTHTNTMVEGNTLKRSSSMQHSSKMNQDDYALYTGCMVNDGKKSRKQFDFENVKKAVQEAENSRVGAPLKQ